MSDSEEDEQPKVKEDDQQIAKEGNINHVERITALIRRGGTIALACTLRCTIF